MTISVVVPAFDAEQDRKTLDGVGQQSGDVEVIVVDDCSQVGVSGQFATPGALPRKSIPPSTAR